MILIYSSSINPLSTNKTTLVNQIINMFVCNNYSVKESKDILKQVSDKLDNQKVVLGYNSYYGNYRNNKAITGVYYY